MACGVCGLEGKAVLKGMRGEDIDEAVESASSVLEEYPEEHREEELEEGDDVICSSVLSMEEDVGEQLLE